MSQFLAGTILGAFIGWAMAHIDTTPAMSEAEVIDRIQRNVVPLSARERARLRLEMLNWLDPEYLDSDKAGA